MSFLAKALLSLLACQQAIGAKTDACGESVLLATQTRLSRTLRERQFSTAPTFATAFAAVGMTKMKTMNRCSNLCPNDLESTENDNKIYKVFENFEDCINDGQSFEQCVRPKKRSSVKKAIYNILELKKTR